jgi:hypothetical protein
VIEPISAWIADAVKIANRYVDPRIIILATGLNEQNLNIAVGRQAIRQQAPGGARSDDNIIKLTWQLAHSR